MTARPSRWRQKMAAVLEDEEHLLAFDKHGSEQFSPRPRKTARWSFDFPLFFKRSGRHTSIAVLMALTAIAMVILALWTMCVRPKLWYGALLLGYQRQPEISHTWGQYSPYFKVPSEIYSDIPSQCHVTFVQALSRHGARDPTLSKSMAYAEIVESIKTRVKTFSGDYSFLANYSYTLGADQLTTFGRHEMVNSGIDFFNRYTSLAKTSVPFIRASGQQRVIESAESFSQGYHEALIANGEADDVNYPYDLEIISEAIGSNNTLEHGLCTAFERSEIGQDAQKSFMFTFAPPLTARLNSNLLNANISLQDTLFMMDLCPFDTVASKLGIPSPFCALFTVAEWEQYDYYQTLGKYYGFGPGNPLGPTQGVGFVNELISRLTGKPVVDHTSVNRTLDTDPDTFPLGRSLYADFGHDNDMTAVFAALGLYANTPPLNMTKMMTLKETHGYSAALTVPFAARAYFEKMECRGIQEEFVRVLVNGRVLPLQKCGGDALGRCTLSSFVESLSFAQAGGQWDQCFVKSVEDGAIATS